MHCDVRGVYWQKKAEKWVATYCGKYLGVFSELQEAIVVRKAAEAKYGPTSPPETIEEAIEYDPETGLFRWKVLYNSSQVNGWFAGCLDGKGYFQITFQNKHRLAHRLGWYLSNGYWPKQLDHINRIKTDNRLSNLREVTRQQNSINTGVPSNNTSGHKGVVWIKRRNKWEARIKVSGVQKHLGYFETLEEAIAARKRGEAKYHHSILPPDQGELF